MTEQTSKRKARPVSNASARETKETPKATAQAEKKPADPGVVIHKTNDGLTMAVRTY